MNDINFFCILFILLYLYNINKYLCRNNQAREYRTVQLLRTYENISSLR